MHRLLILRLYLTIVLLDVPLIYLLSDARHVIAWSAALHNNIYTTNKVHIGRTTPMAASKDPKNEAGTKLSWTIFP